MKQFEVRMTMLVAVTVSVEAENAEDAEKKAMDKTGNDEAYYLSNYDSVWEREVTEVNECEDDEDTTLKAALEYVRDNLTRYDMARIQASIDKSYAERMPPSADCDDSKVIDLLEEYGADNDLPEGWWMEYGEIDDILLKL